MVTVAQLDAGLPQVPLAPDYFRFWPHGDVPVVRLDTAPMLARSRTATRWHRPRTGRSHASGRVSVAYWCGSGSAGPYAFAASLPSGDLACGTCEGRAVGAGYPSSVFPNADVLFSPRTGLPDVCPSEHWEPLNQGWSVGLCRWCGATERVMGGERGYGWTPPRLAPHAPLSLFSPCHDHGYLSVVDVDGALVCECRTERADA